MKHTFAKIPFLCMALLTSCNSKPTTSCDSAYVAQGTITPFKDISSTFTRNDLINLAYLVDFKQSVYDAEGNEITIDPSTMKDYGTLDKELELTIREDYYSINKDKESFVRESVTLDDISIYKYYGYFNDYHIFVIELAQVSRLTVEVSEVISDITFTFPEPMDLLCWKINE